MNDLDFIDKKKHTSIEAELIAVSSIGAQNVYIDKNCYNKPQYISKSSQSNYLFDLEQIELEKELKESDDYTKEILSQSNSNYNSRLDYSIQNDFVEVDLCSENLSYKYNLWGDENMSSKIYLYNSTVKKFCLYDIYIKIQKTSGEFTKKDLLKFVNFRLDIGVGGSDIFYRDFFSICFFELMENQDILIEPNIIYLKAYTFQNMTYGIPKYFLEYHDISISSRGLDSKTHLDFKIDVIISGKNIANIKPEHINKYSHFKEKVILSQLGDKEKIFSGFKDRILFNHPVSILMFFLYNDPDEPDSDELDSPNINAIGLIFDNPNSNKCIWWENDEIIKVNFMGIILCVVPIDPALRDYKKFYNYVNNKADFTQLKSINFSRIDKIYATIEYDNNKKYNLYMNGLHTNLFNIGSGMAGIAFAS